MLTCAIESRTFTCKFWVQGIEVQRGTLDLHLAGMG